jgi:hypothetical protein
MKIVLNATLLIVIIVICQHFADFFFTVSVVLKTVSEPHYGNNLHCCDCLHTHVNFPDTTSAKDVFDDALQTISFALSILEPSVVLARSQKRQYS